MILQDFGRDREGLDEWMAVVDLELVAVSVASLGQPKGVMKAEEKAANLSMIAFSSLPLSLIKAFSHSCSAANGSASKTRASREAPA